MESLSGLLALLRREGRYRSLKTLDSPQGPRIALEGREWLNFSSNDYLGLAADPRVIAALQEGAARYGAGSGAAHLICGHSTAHARLEERLAHFTGRPRALLFSTGYMANLGVIGALTGRRDRIVADRLCHASLLDGALLSRARLQRHPHLDVAALRRLLAAASPGGAPNAPENASPNASPKDVSPANGPEGRCLILTEGVFSMDGDLAPLPELAAAAQEAQAWLLVDDAHGIGVLGEGGGGSLEYWRSRGARLDLEAVPVLVGTLGKALGTAGAFVAGSEALVETLIQRARTYVYTTALPPAVAHATCTSLDIAREETWRRHHLQALCRRFLKGARRLGLPLPERLRALPPESLLGPPAEEAPPLAPIFPLMAGDSRRALRWSEALARAGILVVAIRPPTVPAGSARLRITLSAAHREEDVDRLLEVLAELPP